MSMKTHFGRVFGDHEIENEHIGQRTKGERLVVQSGEKLVEALYLEAFVANCDEREDS